MCLLEAFFVAILSHVHILCQNASPLSKWDSCLISQGPDIGGYLL